jgi:ATP-dependent Lon protease
MLTLLRESETFEVDERVPVLPLRDLVLFPHVVIPLLVGRTASLSAVDAASENRFILLVAQRNPEVQEPVAADLYRVGVVARLLQVARQNSGTTKVLVEGIARARVTRYMPSAEYLRAVIEPAPFPTGDDTPESRARVRSVLTAFEEYVALARRLPPEVVGLINSLDSHARQAFAIAAHMSLKYTVRQKMLELDSIAGLFDRLGEALAGEIELLRLEKKIDEDVRGSLFQNQREFYLQEQLKAIHRELGEEDADDFAEMQAQIERKALPIDVNSRALRELRKLRRTSTLSPEATVGRNYLDWIVNLPWTERTDDVLDVEHARLVLDEDHYGLEEVKDRILDFIAVLSLVGRLEGPLLCLVGPPGVGKTSLGRSVARAMGRRFVRMSLGGVRDEAEIRGHRRTYIGSMPGRVIQAMRRAEVVNPVILLDEVDKLGNDWRGDPAAALLEVLDPEQNRAFNDHYLEVDYDLSQVLFITTANSLSGIPEALRDRLEIIRLAGYLEQEKQAIARKYLIPRQLSANGLDPATVTVGTETVQAVIRSYTREAGVRELERRLARLARKLARRHASARAVDPASPAETRVQVEDLREMLGIPQYDEDSMSLEDKVGVASGLAYTQVGGDVLEIEVASVAGRGKLHLTGTLGDVMKESANAALSYARLRVRALGIDKDFHGDRDLHVHIPAGATPKDGPSAGIAIATAIVSALTGAPVRGDVAMTGEITLRGRVLPIGGLKEKAVAAHRNGIRIVVIPYSNAREIEEFPEEVRRDLVFKPVRTMDEVLEIALRHPHQSARTEPSAEQQPLAH